MKNLQKYLICSIFLISSFCFIKNVNAQYYTYLQPFTSNTDLDDRLVSSIEGSATVQDGALYMNGTSDGYLKYNFDIKYNDIIRIQFDFKKMNTDSYPRLLYIGGIKREIEVKGASNSMYISGEVSSGWVQNEWNHMAITYDKSTIKYFVNGVQVKQENYSGEINFIQFGKGSGSNYFTGYVDNLEITYDYNLDKFDLCKGECLNEYKKFFDHYDTAFKWNNSIYFKNNTAYVYYRKNNINDPTFNFSLTEYPYVLGNKTNEYFCYSDAPFTYNSETDEFMNTSSNTRCTRTSDNDNWGVNDCVNWWKDWWRNGNGIANHNVYDENGDVYISNIFENISPTPSVSIKKENELIQVVNGTEYLTGYQLKIDFTYIDNERYLYMYKLGYDSSWKTVYLTENTYILRNFEENGIVYAKVMDINTHDLVSSSTFTITQIQNIPSSYPRVDIKIKKINKDSANFYIGNSCTEVINNTTYQVCEDLEVIFSVYNSSMYKYQYSFDNITWDTFGHNHLLLDNSQTIRMYDNKTLYVKVINLDNNRLNNSATYTVNKIDKIDSSDQSVIFSAVYYKNEPKIDVYTKFLNYDPQNYNYYFSEYANKDSFIDITNNIICNNNGNCNYKHTFNVSGIVYIKICDKNGNDIKHFTFAANYYKYSNLTGDSFEDFSNIANISDSIKNKIVEVWNSVKNTPLSQYLLIMFIGTCIILIINSLQR